AAVSSAVGICRGGCHQRRLPALLFSRAAASAAADLPAAAQADKSVEKARSLWQKLAYLRPDSPPDARLLRVAVLGPTGVGKSSLVNMLSCYRSCAVSQRINTTRSKQAVISTRGNSQLVFLDLPGLLSEQRRKRFNLENYIMRDVHSTVFQADLILVMADVSHKPSRSRLDPEVLKALHYFADKPSVLVLNKVDLLRGSRVRLLDTVRCLTDGVVAGRVSHVDKYAGRIEAIDRAVRELQALEGRAEAADEAALTDGSDWHGRWDRSWERYLVPPVERLQRHLLPPPDVLMWGPNPPAPTPLLLEENRRAALLDDEADEQRLLTAVPDGGEGATENEDDDPLPASLAEADDRSALASGGRPPSLSQLDPFALWLREQMLLGAVTKEEALARRRRWREIGRLIQGQATWRGFQEVFMVSAATGHGVDRLRDYLFSIALPRPWLFHSSCLSDMEPLDLVRMCIWARCLDLLPQEVPYRLGFELLDLDRSRDGRLFISARIRCPSLRALTCVIGQDGANIREIATRSKEELQDVFKSGVVLKLSAVRSTVPGGHLKLMKQAESFAQLLPDVSH
uniref:G domain-containing protein n=2 Tax=Macrostomum lignano TaxID=282301 RepID=A0A1I8GUR8_9PLAT